MIELTQEHITGYFHRSFSVIDGLWFMKIEEKYGFETALEIDREIWKVVPKIQARTLKSMKGLENGSISLQDALETKLTLEDYTFETEKIGSDGGFQIKISTCPWHELMVKSGRKHLSEKIGRAICSKEYQIWASEFDDSVEFTLKEQLCGGRKECILCFTKKRE